MSLTPILVVVVMSTIGARADLSVKQAIEVVRQAHSVEGVIAVTGRTRVPVPTLEPEVLEVLRAIPDADVQWDDRCQCEVQTIVRTTYWVNQAGQLRSERRNVTAQGDADRLTSVHGLNENGIWTLANKSSTMAEIRPALTIPGAALRSRIHRGEYVLAVRACLELLTSESDTQLVDAPESGLLRLNSESAGVWCEFDALSGEVTAIRAQRIPGAFVEYRFGPRTELSLLPARYPRYKTWSNDPPQAGQSAFLLEEYETVHIGDEAAGDSFRWEHWVPHAHDMIDGRVIRVDGSTDEALTQQLLREGEQRSSAPPDLFIEAPDGSLKPRPRGGQVRGWLLAGGVTCLALGVAVWYRRRTS